MNLKDLNSFDFGFNWKETTTQKTITTNNIWFEYYSVVYNIGIMLYLIAENLVIQGNYTTLTLEQAKEAREKYSQALFYFEKIKNEIEDAVGNLIIRTEHVGSTAVIGMWAKPCIDIDVVIKNYSVFEFTDLNNSIKSFVMGVEICS